MFKKLVIASGIVLSGWLGAAVLAQEPSTLVMKSGERISGELIDMNASGFALRVNGQDRMVSTGDVAAVEFVGGAIPADAQNRVNAGQQVVVLRSGQVIEGRLSDVGGTRPLRLTIDTPSGQRDFNSSDVAQVYFGRATAAQAVGTSGQAAQAPAGSQTITVPANQAWTDTGITVRRGESIQFYASGDIMVSDQASSGVGGSPIAAGGRLPVPTAGVGALIARVGNGAPFLVASNTSPIPVQANGRLQLGINDDHHADNSGSFSVAVVRQGR
ncbi:MAG TPA: hypothetical protein VM032_06375 [Vicinamibacterales bacterium]|nr:hypothetical protein [Vicinamibacterales bacterium]